MSEAAGDVGAAIGGPAASLPVVAWDAPEVIVVFGYEQRPRIVSNFRTDRDRDRMVLWIERAAGGEYQNLLNRAAELAEREAA